MPALVTGGNGLARQSHLAEIKLRMKHLLPLTGLSDHGSPGIHHQRMAIAGVAITLRPGTGAGEHKALGIDGAGPHHQMPVPRPGGGVEGGGTGQQRAAMALLHQQGQLREADVVTDQQAQVGRIRQTGTEGVTGAAEHGGSLSITVAVL